MISQVSLADGKKHKSVEARAQKQEQAGIRQGRAQGGRKIVRIVSHCVHQCNAEGGRSSHGANKRRADANEPADVERAELGARG